MNLEAHIESVRAEYDVDEPLEMLQEELWRHGEYGVVRERSFRTAVEENEEAVNKLVREVATLRATLERLESPDETMRLAMFEASRGAMYMNFAEPVLRAALASARDAAREEG